MILFRADGNPWIGTGHIMRCLSLADALQEYGESISFVTAEPYCQKMIQARGYPCAVLGTAYDRMKKEFSVFLPYLKRERPTLIVLDSYYVTPRYMETIKGLVPLLYIDDLTMFDYPADIVVNTNIYGPEVSYPQNKIYFLGPKYVPLRKEFQGLKQRITREQVENILVSTGGTDQYHVALRCIKYLQDYVPVKGMVFHFVLGVMNQDVEELQEIASRLPFIELHRQVADMRSLMLQCDVAISAAGTTLYELCACGLPAVTYILADNQIQGAKAFQKAELMPCAGDVRCDEQFEEQLFTQLFNLMENGKIRSQTAQRMQELVDGAGAQRLASKILSVR